MNTLPTPPKLTDQVHAAIVADIVDGKLRPGERVIQEQVAEALGVSRQPVQQALLLLRQQGLLVEAPGRGLIVTPLDPDEVWHICQVRAVVEGLAFRLAAANGSARAARLGPSLIARGREAIQTGSVSALVAADMAFHNFVCDLSGNPAIAPTLAAQWVHVQRAMGQVLARPEVWQDIWNQHEAMIAAVVAGDERLADRLAQAHILHFASNAVEHLRVEAGGHPTVAHANGAPPPAAQDDRSALAGIRLGVTRPFG